MRVSVALGGFLTAEQVTYRSKTPAQPQNTPVTCSIELQIRSTRHEIVFASPARLLGSACSAVAHVPQRNASSRIEKLHVTVGSDHVGQNLAHRGQ
jgi:hypothetical protein